MVTRSTSQNGLHSILLRLEFDYDPDATPLGLFDHMKVGKPNRFSMAAGDIFAVISDGIFESTDPEGVEFGIERTMEVIRRHREAEAAEILSQIRGAVEEFTRGAPAADDRTIILIKGL